MQTEAERLTWQNIFSSRFATRLPARPSASLTFSRRWDDDKSGKIDKKEFTQAVRALGFDVDDDEAGAVFDSLDDDNSGELEYAELNTMLRKNSYGDAVRRRLARAKDVRDDSRSAKFTHKNSNINYTGARLAVLDESVKLSADSGVSVQEQLAEIMAANSVKLIDVRELVHKLFPFSYLMRNSNRPSALNLLFAFGPPTQ